MADNASLYNLHSLTGHIAVTLPQPEEAHVTLRHIHTIDMHNHKITVIVPARLFNSEAFLPGTAQPFYREEAKSLLAFLSGQPVAGHQ